MLDAFRNEIVEAEKSRIDLLKWKLFLVAAIGSVGLGFNPDESSPIISPTILLCFVPMICVYVDSLCRHLQLRILAISDFYSRYDYRNGRDDTDDMIRCFSRYENFCHKVREGETDIFDLEDWAMDNSTKVLSGLVIFTAVFLAIDRSANSSPFTSELMVSTVFQCLFLIISGWIGIRSSESVDQEFQRKRKKLRAVANDFDFRQVIYLRGFNIRI
ncbi:MAG: hypothetical protein AAFQ63_12415 [Cyanobacteria bacterium J06621_11]